eukprot:6414189-Amphidinium_carterae.1
MPNVQRIALNLQSKPECRACGVIIELATLSRKLLHLAVRACGVATAWRFRACGVIALARVECGWLWEDGNVLHEVVSFMMSPWA